MLKILQARFQQYVKLWIFRYWSWFYRRQRNQISNCQHPWNQWKSESSRKTSISALLTLPKPLTVWITINCGKFWKRWQYQTTWPASWEICMQVRKQQLELDMEQQTVSKEGKEYVKAIYCHPDNLTYTQSTSWETLEWKKHKLESSCWEKYQYPQICRWYYHYGKKWRRIKEALDESERVEWES